MPLIAAAVACLLDAAAAVLLGRRMMRGAEAASLSSRLPLTPAAMAVLVHGYVVFATTVGDGVLRLGLFNAASLVAWVVALMLVVAAWRMPVENLGIAIFPLAGVLALASTMDPTGGAVVSSASRGIDLHILTSVLAYSLLTIAAFQAVLLAVQDHHLHSRQPGGMIRALPPLQTMEQLLFRMIVVGFVLLSVSLLSGLLFVEDLFAQHLIHKTVLSIVAWGVFSVLLWGRWKLGWRGRQAIRWTLGGFVALMLAYFGSKFVLELVLQRV
ncbi:MAG: cytochrome c biogenesis protein CcsA [Gammaproteobacteria bacterium]|nr:cytochrome c biogenesis protein CcsA [Gammaproteobacteria bacterium]